MRLGVNIDHVATLRNARGESHPSPIHAAKFVKKCGADSITIHLREDRRHINDLDVRRICKNKKLTVVKPGTQKRDFTHIDDTIDGILKASIGYYGDGYVIRTGIQCRRVLL